MLKRRNTMSVKREPITGIRQPIVFDKQNECPYEKPFGYIYMITNNVNGHMYIGKHKFNKPYLDKSYWGSGTVHLQNAYNKYGKDNFTRSILQWIETNNDDLNEAEIKWIDVFDTYSNPKHYNKTHGGDGNVMSGESHPLYKKGYLIAGENNPFWGKKHTEESRKLMSKALLGKYRGKNSPNYGRIHTEEERQKNRKAHLGKGHTDEWKANASKRVSGGDNPWSRRVVQYDLDWNFVREYSYIGETRLYGFDPNGVSLCCRGKNKDSIYRGFHWKYKEN